MSGRHINLDDAWDPRQLPFPTVDARPLGPHLRYIAPEKIIRRSIGTISEGIPAETRLLLYGSGDFHYLAAWWLRRALDAAPGDVRLISFDNHPDWDVRPPRWACGGWINRALEFPEVVAVSVWGCGNFELTFPARLFRNRTALRTSRLTIHPWSERYPASVAARFDAMARNDWRERFDIFVQSIAGKRVYVTIDLDALAAEHAVTNWENGLFTAEDIAWAIEQLKQRTQIIGIDLCGAYSDQRYARRFQRFAARFDHPKIPPKDASAAKRRNHDTFAVLWPTLAAL